MDESKPIGNSVSGNIGTVPRSESALRRSKSQRDVKSERALDLARRFRAANEELIAFTQALTDDDWMTWCEPEGRRVGQVIEHVAAGHLVIGDIVEAMALGLPLPVAARRTAATGARFNARQAATFDSHTREQALRALRRNGLAIERFLAALTDDELARTIDTIEGPLSTEEEIVGGLFGHLRSHFDAVEASLRRGPI